MAAVDPLLILNPAIMKPENWNLQQLQAALKERKINSRSTRPEHLYDLLLGWARANYVPNQPILSNLPLLPLDPGAGAPAAEVLDPAAMARLMEKTRSQLDALARARGLDPSACPSKAAVIAMLRQWVTEQPAGGGNGHDQEPDDTQNYSGSIPSGPDLFDHDQFGSMDDVSHLAIWTASFTTIVANSGKDYPALRDLTPQAMTDIGVNDMVLLYYYKNIFLYTVTARESAGSTVSMASWTSSKFISGVAPPEPVYFIPSDMMVHVLTPASRRYFTAYVAKMGGTYRVTWPTEIIDLGAEEDPAAKRTRMAGPYVSAGGGGAPSSRLASLVDSLLESSGGVSSKSKCLRGQDFTEQAARVLSEDPITVINTGAVNLFMQLFYIGQPSEVTAISGCSAYWAVTAWRTQIQPFHLLQLARNITLVDIRLFASVLDVQSRQYADALGQKLQTYEDKVGDVAAVLNIIGGHPERLLGCLANFAITLDVVFLLRPAIREALRNMIVRTMSLARGFQLSPTAAEASTLYHYLAQQFQTTTQAAFGRVRGGSATQEAVISIFAAFPDLSPYSDLTNDLLLIRSTRAIPDCMKPFALPTGHGPGATSPGIKRDRDLDSVTPAPRATVTKEAKQGTSKSPKKRKTICGFYCTTEGCTKGSACLHEHRPPQTDDDREFLDRFYKRFPSRTPMKP